MTLGIKKLDFMAIALAATAMLVACGDDSTDTTSAASASGGGHSLSDGGAGTGGENAGGSSGSGGSAAGGNSGTAPFPTAMNNVFSIQYRNSSGKPISVWLEGSQPPCSEAQALQCDTFLKNQETPADYTSKWQTLQQNGVFTASGTVFEVIDPDQRVENIKVSNRVDLVPGQTLRITPPIVDGKAEWFWKQNGVAFTAGVKGWITPQGTPMPASQHALLYEYNITPGVLYWDLSAVDGLNANATMTYAGPGCMGKSDCECNRPMPRVCSTNIDPFDGNNDGCPYIIPFDGSDTCPNPKFYDKIDSSKPAPSWVTDRSLFTTEPVSSTHSQIWMTAGSPTGAEMASAPSGDTSIKPAYHIWWSKNPVGTGWLNYLQKNKGGPCNAYGWAYDEKKWEAGDPFDSEGNPPDNTPVEADVQCDIKSDTYVNIDITKVM